MPRNDGPWQCHSLGIWRVAGYWENHETGNCASSHATDVNGPRGHWHLPNVLSGKTLSIRMISTKWKLSSWHISHQGEMSSTKGTSLWNALYDTHYTLDGPPLSRVTFLQSSPSNSALLMSFLLQSRHLCRQPSPLYLGSFSSCPLPPTKGTLV